MRPARILLLAAAASLLAGMAASEPLKDAHGRRIAWALAEEAYGPERVFEGRLHEGHEDSSFTPDGETEACWLAGDPGYAEPAEGAPYPDNYHLRFKGRRSLERGRYGHLGGWPCNIVVTQPIEAIPLSQD